MTWAFVAGNKVNNIDIVYTPWSNLKKTANMDVGQVGFHNSKMVSFVVLSFVFASIWFDHACGEIYLPLFCVI